jgi:uncharacterized membrane protein YhhN
VIAALLATAACAAATGALLAAELAISRGRAGETARRPAKLCAAAAFVATALLAGAWSWRVGRWIGAGLAFGALGDAALLGRKRRAFVLGMALFAVDHACVLRAAALVTPPSTWSAAWLAAPAAVAAAAVWRLWRNLGMLRAPVVLYAALIAVMLTGAAAPLLAGPPAWFGARRAALLAGGALCFFLSDLAVARQRFAHESFWNKAWGLPLYFGGQLLIAWSAAA